MAENWTYLNQQEIVDLMRLQGADVSRRVVPQLLNKHNYVKRKSQKQKAGGSCANRNEQFENILKKVNDFKSTQDPVVSMDTKKKNR